MEEPIPVRGSDTPSQRLRELAAYVAGHSAAIRDETLGDAAKWLYKASRNICRQGYFGCRAGDRCESDHK